MTAKGSSAVLRSEAETAVRVEVSEGVVVVTGAAERSFAVAVAENMASENAAGRGALETAADEQAGRATAQRRRERAAPRSSWRCGGECPAVMSCSRHRSL